MKTNQATENLTNPVSCLVTVLVVMMGILYSCNEVLYKTKNRKSKHMLD
jgi:hypothetical protein